MRRLVESAIWVAVVVFLIGRLSPSVAAPFVLLSLSIAAMVRADSDRASELSRAAAPRDVAPERAGLRAYVAPARALSIGLAVSAVSIGGALWVAGAA